MTLNYNKEDKRIIKVEPNPFKKPKQRIKMKVKRMQGTQPVINQNGQVLYKEEEPKNLTRIPGTSKTIVPGRTINGINTGLDGSVLNPYIDEPVYKYEWAERILKGKEKAKLQHLLEYEFGFEFDYLTSQIPNEVTASNKPDKKFFERPESRIVLKDNINFLDMKNPVHRINYYTLLASKEVANSYTDLEDGLNQDAEWYFSDDHEKDQYILGKIEKETKSAAALEDLKNSDEAVQQMCKALDIEEANDRNLSKVRAARLLYDYYNQNDECWKRYIDFYEMWKDHARRNYVIASAELFDYVKTGVITFKNGKYTWYKQIPGKPAETYIRISKNDMIQNFLLDAAFQEEVELIQEQYENKIK